MIFWMQGYVLDRLFEETDVPESKSSEDEHKCSLPPEVCSVLSSRLSSVVLRAVGVFCFRFVRFRICSCVAVFDRF